MNRLLLLSFCILFTSCELFKTKKLSSEEILSEESLELNWHEVDQYPSFADCREIMEEEASRECFETKVANFVYARLEQKRPVVTDAINDTVWLHLVVSEKGTPTIDSVELDSLVLHHLPELKTWIGESVDSLPKIYPANKRGIPVATKFKMPIVIKAE